MKISLTDIQAGEALYQELRVAELKLERLKEEADVAKSELADKKAKWREFGKGDTQLLRLVENRVNDLIELGVMELGEAKPASTSEAKPAPAAPARRIRKPARRVRPAPAAAAPTKPTAPVAKPAKTTPAKTPAKSAPTKRTPAAKATATPAPAPAPTTRKATPAAKKPAAAKPAGKAADDVPVKTGRPRAVPLDQIKLPEGVTLPSRPVGQKAIAEDQYQARWARGFMSGYAQAIAGKPKALPKRQGAVYDGVNAGYEHGYKVGTADKAKPAMPAAPAAKASNAPAAPAADPLADWEAAAPAPAAPATTRPIAPALAPTETIGPHGEIWPAGPILNAGEAGLAVESTYAMTSGLGPLTTEEFNSAEVEAPKPPSENPADELGPIGDIEVDIVNSDTKGPFDD
jgi:hypothetical protein